MIRTIKWHYQDADIEVEYQMVGSYYSGTYLQPPEYPELEIINAKFVADGVTLTEEELEDLYNDDELYNTIADLHDDRDGDPFDNGEDELMERMNGE